MSSFEQKYHFDWTAQKTKSFCKKYYNVYSTTKNVLHGAYFLDNHFLFVLYLYHRNHVSFPSKKDSGAKFSLESKPQFFNQDEKCNGAKPERNEF